jgi:hypothetical protein
MEFLGIATTCWQDIGIAIATLVDETILGRLVLFIVAKRFAPLARPTPTNFEDAILDAVLGPLPWVPSQGPAHLFDRRGLSCYNALYE